MLFLSFYEKVLTFLYPKPKPNSSEVITVKNLLN